jgi:hypothetical protein
MKNTPKDHIIVARTILDYLLHEGLTLSHHDKSIVIQAAINFIDRFMTDTDDKGDEIPF